MSQITVRTFVAGALCCALFVSLQSSAQAQGRGRGGFGPVSQLALAQLEEVQKELQLTEEQKGHVKTLNEELNGKRRELFQSAQGDFARAMAEGNKLAADYAARFNKVLDEPQQARMLELFVQVNGTGALADDGVAAALKLTDEQKSKIRQANEEALGKMREAFRDFQDLSQEERQKRGQELRESQEKSLMAVLTDEQKTSFEKLKADKLEIDLSKLPRPGRRQE